MYDNNSEDAIRAQEIALGIGYVARSGPCDKTEQTPSGLESKVVDSKPWFSITIDLGAGTTEYSFPDSKREERK
jgi:hypothetical protein